MDITIEDIERAHDAIRAYIHKTPVLTSESFNSLCDGGKRRFFFKCEAYQRTGSFKARGAMNAVLSLPEGVTSVVTHSSGNHGQALAYAAKSRGLEAHIVMPSTAPVVKVAAVGAYGAHIHVCEPTIAARQAAAASLVESTRGVFIHPSNERVVICGQGTVGLELMQQVKEEHGVDLDAVIVPVGGGGLLSGIATAVKGKVPKVLVIGAEPSSADDAYRSKQAGVLCMHAEQPRSIADGLLTVLGDLTLPIVLSRVDEIVTVSEEAIVEGMKVVYERLKVVIEPSAGVGVAVAMSEYVRSLPPHVKNVGVVLCGGNVQLDRLAQLFATASQQS